MASITLDPALINPSEETSLFAYNSAFHELGSDRGADNRPTAGIGNGSCNRRGHFLSPRPIDAAQKREQRHTQNS